MRKLVALLLAAFVLNGCAASKPPCEFKAPTQAEELADDCEPVREKGNDNAWRSVADYITTPGSEGSEDDDGGSGPDGSEGDGPNGGGTDGDSSGGDGTGSSGGNGKAKSDNSDANGKGGNRKDRTDKTKGGTERAEAKKGV